MKKQVVSFHYTLKNKEGKVIDSSNGNEPLTFLEGASQIIPGLEKGVKGMKKGEKKAVVIAPDDGYGQYDKRFVISVNRDQLPEGEIKVGDQFQVGPSPEESQVVQVMEVNDKTVTLDGNHPLAGQDLFFDVEIADVRDATEEELTHGHAHGAHGHHH
ncbi:MAG: peptidylprolyl isomerase [Phaeospirillum sp.]|nr:peptidylprolyl isomerase [Phaeospirillum sp.]